MAAIIQTFSDEKTARFWYEYLAPRPVLLIGSNDSWILYVDGEGQEAWVEAVTYLKSEGFVVDMLHPNWARQAF